MEREEPKQRGPRIRQRRAFPRLLTADSARGGSASQRACSTTRLLAVMVIARSSLGRGRGPACVQRVGREGSRRRRLDLSAWQVRADPIQARSRLLAHLSSLSGPLLDTARWHEWRLGRLPSRCAWPPVQEAHAAKRRLDVAWHGGGVGFYTATTRSNWLSWVLGASQFVLAALAFWMARRDRREQPG